MFSPVVPLGGIAGWQLLQRTQEHQKESFLKSPEVARNIEDFRARIGQVETAEALVGDYQLLQVSLGAFGLEQDIDNRFFIQKVLQEGTLDEAAFANRLSDDSYGEMAAAFGFGDFDTPRTVLSDFPEEIISAYSERAFEVAVGEQDAGLRLAMNLQRDLPELAADEVSDEVMWYRIMGSAPMREVFEKALGLPASFGSLDLDLQMQGFRSKTAGIFGDSSVAQFADPEKLEELTRRYLVMAELSGESGGNRGGSTALSILSGASPGSLFELLI